MWLHITSALLVLSMVGIAFDSVFFFTTYYPVEGRLNNIIKCEPCHYMQQGKCHDQIIVNVTYIFNEVTYTTNTSTTERLCGSPCCDKLPIGSLVTVKIDPIRASPSIADFMWANNTIIETFYISVCLLILFGTVFFISSFLVLVDIAICLYQRHQNHRYYYQLS